MSLHPIQRPRGYVVITQAVKELLTRTSAAFEVGDPSLAYMAPPRTGKSCALKELTQRYMGAGRALCLHARVTPQPGSRLRTRSNEFWRALRGDQLAADAGLVHQNPQLALFNFIRNECDKLGTESVLIVLDEAQNLRVLELDQLKALTDALVDKGYRPFVLLVGQPELQYLREFVEHHGRTDLTERFFTTLHRLPGLTKPDIELFCEHIDSAVWPVGSGTTYTAHFVPAPWATGWRLAQSSDLVWSEFARHASSLGVNVEGLELGPQYVAKAALLILNALANEPRRVHLLAPVVRGAVEASGYRASKILPRSNSSDKGDTRLKMVMRWYRATGA
jgi:type II secretory pathway predicted ATPase ExeA